MSRCLKPIAGVLLIFLLGAAAGVLGTLRVVENRRETVLRGGAPALAEAATRRLDRTLDLDADQRAAVRAALQRAITRWQEVRRQVDPDLRGVLRSAEQEIRAVLTPAQLVRYDELVRSRRPGWLQESAPLDP